MYSFYIFFTHLIRMFQHGLIDRLGHQSHNLAAVLVNQLKYKDVKILILKGGKRFISPQFEQYLW